MTQLAPAPGTTLQRWTCRDCGAEFAAYDDGIEHLEQVHGAIRSAANFRLRHARPREHDHDPPQAPAVPKPPTAGVEPASTAVAPDDTDRSAAPAERTAAPPKGSGAAPVSQHALACPECGATFQP